MQDFYSALYSFFQKIDITSFGFIAMTAVIIVVISIIVFRLYPKETDFEEAYGKNALRLLNEDRAVKTKNAKGKNKIRNGEKRKDSGGEEKENRNIKYDNGIRRIKLTDFNRLLEAEKLNDAENRDVDAKPNRKKHKGKHFVTSETTNQNELERTEKNEIVKDSGESLEQEIIEKAGTKPVVAVFAKDEDKNTDTGERKSKKKNRINRQADDHLHDMSEEEVKMVEEIVPVAETIVPLGTEVKSEKPKPKKVKDLDVDKFQARLNNLSELEPEYVTFIAKYINDVDAQRIKFTDELAVMRKKIADKDRIVLQCTDKLAAAQKKDSEVAMLQKTLTEEKKKHKLFEETVCAQMSTSAQEKSYLQRKCDQLQVELGAITEELNKAQSVIHSTPPAVDIKPYQQQIDLLKAKLKSNESRCSQLEIELNQRSQALQQFKNETQKRDHQIEHLSQTNAMLEKRMQDMENCAKAERDALETKLQNTMKMAEELGAVTSEIRTEMLQHKEDAETAALEREKYCEQIRVLNAQVADANKDRENYISECANYSAKLAEMETANRKLSSRLQALQCTSAVSDANCKKLMSEMELCRKQLADSEQQYEEDTTKLKKELARLREEKEKCEQQMWSNLSKEVAEITQYRKELEEFKNDYKDKLKHILYLEDEVMKYKKAKEEKPTQCSAALFDSSGATVAEKVMEFAHVHGSESTPNTVAVASGGNNTEHLIEEINELKMQNEALRKANYKVVEISQQQEANFKQHLEELKENHEKIVRFYHSEISKTLSGIQLLGTKIPHLPVSCSMDQFSSWLKSVAADLPKEVRSNIEQFKKEDGSNSSKGVAEAEVADIEARNQRYRASLTTLSHYIDVIEHEAALKEKAYLSEISRLRQEISKQLKKQLEDERKRKQELISQASKLCEVLDRTKKWGEEKVGTSGLQTENSDALAVRNAGGGAFVSKDNWKVLKC